MFLIGDLRYSQRWRSKTSLVRHNADVMMWRWRQQGPPTPWYGTSLHSVSTWRWRHKVSPKRWYPTTSLHEVTTQKTWTWIFTAVKTRNLVFFQTPSTPIETKLFKEYTETYVMTRLLKCVSQLVLELGHWSIFKSEILIRGSFTRWNTREIGISVHENAWYFLN
jgi:hypothetical protein